MSIPASFEPGWGAGQGRRLPLAIDHRPVAGTAKSG
jgi:hypothetical protein